jgi:hypothetical protein
MRRVHPLTEPSLQLSCSQHVPSGAAASAAGLLRDPAAGTAGGSRGAHARAAAADAHAPLLRLLAHRALGLVPVPLAPRQLRVGHRPREGGGARGHAIADAGARMLTPARPGAARAECVRVLGSWRLVVHSDPKLM